MKSRIANIYIEIPNENIDAFRSGHIFIGRAQVKEKLKSLIRINKNGKGYNKGVYLVAGYRGVGKTALVEKCIEELNKEHIELNEEKPIKKHFYSKIEKYVKIQINLSQENVRDIDLLRMIALSLEKELTPIISEIDLGRLVLSRLNLLITRINSIYKETSLGEVVMINEKEKAFTRTYQYEKIQIKDIEKELIEIFNNINEARTHDPKIPFFVIIVDELDKIEPSFLFEITYSLDIEIENQVHGMNKVRKRQEIIAKILSNLKSFLNVAKAKFIFIGGREMYDATLADVADRDSFYSSIFHDYIYVNSFFKDSPESGSGITRMTEAYLCNLLQPKKSSDNSTEQPTIKKFIQTVFNELLDDNINQKNNYLNKNKLDLIENNEILKTRIKTKLIKILLDYVIYLTYRSNGLPKKLINLIEGDIVYDTVGDIDKNQDSLVIRNHNKKANEKISFLKFSYTRQYEISLTSNLYRPYITIHSRYIKALNDKLLYSSAYIMDFLLKYHPFGFSWKNLENIPDIILMHKDPNLRPFMKDILEYLQSIYLRPSISGLHEYKYYSRVTTEIKYLCKVSEEASAAFNFTLDESLQIKRFYLNRFSILNKEVKDADSNGNTSLTYITTILGDLYFYDGEYDEAILYYNKAIEVFTKNRKNKNIPLDQLHAYTKTSLKLGLAHQKIHNYDRAYTVFRNTIFKVINTNLKYNIHKENSENLKVSYSMPVNRLHLFIQPYIAVLETIEKDRTDGITFVNISYAEQEIKSFLGAAKEYSKDSKRVEMLLSDIYLSIGNILYYKNYNYPEIYEMLKTEPANLFNLKLDYHNFIKTISLKESPEYYPSISACVYYRKALHHFLQKFEFKENLTCKTDDYQLVVHLLLNRDFYNLNFQNLYFLANLLSKIGDSLLTMISQSSIEKFISSEEKVNTLYDLLKQFSIDVNSMNQFSEINSILEKYRNMTLYKEFNNQLDSYYDFNRPLILYFLSAQFFMKAGNNYNYCAQLKKSLGLVKDLIKFSAKKEPSANHMNKYYSENSDSFIKILEKIAVNFFNSLTWAYDTSNRPQILKYRDYFKPVIEPIETAVIYNNISNSHESREIILIVEEIRMMLVRNPNGKRKFTDLFSPFDQISNKMVRILELRFRSIQLYNLSIDNGNEIFYRSLSPILLYPSEKIFNKDLNIEHKFEYLLNLRSNKIFTQKYNNYFEDFDLDWEHKMYDRLTLENEILEGIFCMSEAIKIMNIFTPSYSATYSMLASFHQKMGHLCIAYRNFEILFGEIKTTLHDNVYLEHNYHFELATKYYYLALEAHKGGKTYKGLTENMSYLEDDYNDNLYHFAAASERFRINTGVIRSNIKKLKKYIKYSKIYNYNSHLLPE